MTVNVDVATLIREAGFPDGQPVSIAARGRGGALAGVSGLWSRDRQVETNDLFYAASLTKQVTGVVAAMLAVAGVLDPDAPVQQDYLPNWAELPTPRHLLHHVGGVNEDAAGLGADAAIRAAAEGDGRGSPQHWTNVAALETARRLPLPELPPGSVHAYSNVGYILLAREIEALAGRPFAELVASVLPKVGGWSLANDDTLPQSPHVAWLGPCLPLSTGDGGLWTNASTYLDFLDAQNTDELGLGQLTRSDYRLPSGEAVAYGWGVGIRAFREQALYIHGGGWMGCRAKAVRSPALGLSAVVLTTSDPDGAVGRLTDRLCELVAG